MRQDDTPDAGGLGSGYAASMLAKAFFTFDTHADPAVRELAAARVLRWQHVLAHTLSGKVEYGSRTPLPGIPDWVTLDVATGGFATGGLLAGGPLTDAERTLASNRPGIRAGSERRDLNAYYLSEDGVAELQARLADGAYSIDLPEEAALMVVAWLLSQGQAQAARDLVQTLMPFFDRLRFYPSRWIGPGEPGAGIFVSTAGEVARLLSRLQAQPRIAAQRATVHGLLPRHDRAVALFLETVEDDWPCRRYPEGWAQRAAALIAEVHAAQAMPGQAVSNASRRHRHKRELFDLLACCAHTPEALTGRQVGRIRRIVQDYVTAHGTPDSDGLRALRVRQGNDVAAPGYHDIARLIAARLQAYSEETGVQDLAPVLEPLSDAEAHSLGLPSGAIVPAPVARRVRRCQSGTISELVTQGLIGSSECLATLVPQITASLQGGGFVDPALRALHGSTYQAFRRRRSLLLLNLARQAAFKDLPWIAAVESYRQPAQADSADARAALVDIASLSWAAFPHAPLPNKLLQELSALLERGQWDLPLVDELAADIFMGRFSPKFVEAARQAAALLDGTLYANYYAINTQEVMSLPSPRKTRGTDGKVDALGRFCAARAGVQAGFGSVAANGMVIEQQQILTTHNLAVLAAGAGLAPLFQDRFGPLALSAFKWLCARQQMKIDGWHARLRMLRNTAYAWRQAMFFLSMLPSAEQDATIAAMETHLSAQSAEFQQRFRPAMNGLHQAARGARLPQHEAGEQGARVFRGWAATPHWLMPPDSR